MDIEAILTQLRAEQQRLDVAIRALEGVGGIRVATKRATSGKRVMSPEARAKIAAAARRRWAAAKKKGKTTLAA